MAKVITASQAADMISNGARVMFGGFMQCGAPHHLIDAVLKKGVKDLFTISNDHCRPEMGLSKLVANGQIKKSIVTHVGLNPQTGSLREEGKIELEIIPQGTFAERVRAGGAGLGGILTPTGLGTLVEEGKQKITVNGQEFLLEEAIKADFALIHAHTADKAGNLFYKGTARNFNPLMAMAGATVIVEVENIIDGYLDVDCVHTPGTLVDYIVKII